MKLSTKGRYGLKAMIDLAVHVNEGQVVLKNIAERQEISENYLEQLFALLKKAKLVKSIRGSQGGYILAEDPGKITVGDILRALEGSLAPVDCVLDDEKSGCSRSDICVTRSVWKRINDKINETVDSITLHDLMEDYDRMSGSANQMYFI